MFSMLFHKEINQVSGLWLATVSLKPKRRESDVMRASRGYDPCRQGCAIQVFDCLLRPFSTGKPVSSHAPVNVEVMNQVGCNDVALDRLGT